MGDRRRPGHTPRYWNVYRPSYDSAPRNEYRSPSRAQNSAHILSPSSLLQEGSAHDDVKPDTSSFRPGRAHQIDYDIRETRETDHEQLPQIWDDELEELMGRTVRAYDVVIHYEHDSDGGQRWSPEHIDLIRNLGKNLHDDLQDLRHWQRTVARNGNEDETRMSRIKEDVEKMRAYCRQVQGAIKQYESHFLPVDDQGNIYANGGVFDRLGRPLNRSTRRRSGERASNSRRSRNRRLVRSQSPEPEARQKYRSRQELDAGRAHQQGIAGRLGKHIMHY